MKRIFISVFIIASFILYALLNVKTETARTVSMTPSPTPNTNSDNVAINRPKDTEHDEDDDGTTVQSTPTPQPTLGQAKGNYRDGEYTGNVVDAFYGNIQVKAIIRNGRLADVQFLQYPNDQRESIEINTEAMPILTQEAIQAQDAQVDVVSRATDSSHAFMESLASALRQAK